MRDVAVIYCRKSDPSAKSDDPAFEQQEQACRKYCDEKGYTVLSAQRESYTGTDLANQQLLWECVDDIKTGRAKVLVAYSYDRLSREPQMQEVALYEIEKKYGGRFEAATEQIDRSDPFREAFRGILGAASSVERRRTVGRMQRGKVDRAKRGALYGCSNPKFGYRWEDDTPGQRTRFAVDEHHADTVRRIFEWADNGKGLRWIAKQLNLKGVPTPSQAAMMQGHAGTRVVSRIWRHSSVQRILEDPAYIGRMEAYRRQQSQEYVKNPTTGIMENKLVISERDLNDPNRIALACPAIVPVDQWKRVQVTLAGNKNKEGQPPRDPETAMMRGHVFCKCGRRMSMVRLHQSYVYKCNARGSVNSDPSISCPYGEHGVVATIVNQFTLEDVSKVIAKRGLLRQLLEQKFEDDKPLRQIAESLTRLVQRKRSERDNYLAGLGVAQNATVVQSLVELVEKCTKEIEEAGAKIAEANMRLNSIDQHKAAFERTIALLEQWPADALYDLSPEERRRLFRQIGLKVVVSPAGTYVGAKRLAAEYAVAEDQSFSGSTFQKLAQDAKVNCPVSKALAATPINLTATLTTE